MNVAIMFMHALKETCALHCLLALHIAGPLPVTQRTVMDITGFEEDAVRKGLNKLLVLGLVICSGQDRRTGWQLAPNARQLPLGWLTPAKPGLEVLKEEGHEGTDGVEESEVIEKREEAEVMESSLGAGGEAGREAYQGCEGYAGSEGHVGYLRCEGTRGAQRTPAPGPQAAEGVGLASGASRPARDAMITPPGKPAPKASSTASVDAKSRAQARRAAAQPSKCKAPPASPRDRALRAQLLAVMARAHVWPNLRLMLADELLAEDGAGWVRQALGWVCYGVRRFPRWDLGAVVYPALRDRLPVDPDYLPPPELDFGAALAWAEAGGEPGAGYANAAEADPEPRGVPRRQPPLDTGAETPNARSPEARLWEQALRRLATELPGAPLESWLGGARLEARGARRYRLAVPTPQARDWLANRLQARLQQALGAAAGEAVELEIALQATQKRTPTEGGQLG